MNKIYKYFVEGECEEKIINALKISPVNGILPGKVEVFNVINKKLTPARLAIIPPDAIIILIYDTDVEKTDILEQNILLLNQFGFKNIHHIHSIKNFEDELVFSTELTNIHQMYNTNSEEEFKTKFMHQNNILVKLRKHKFDSNKLWSRTIKRGGFKKYSNQESIELIKKNKYSK